MSKSNTKKERKPSIYDSIRKPTPKTGGPFKTKNRSSFEYDEDDDWVNHVDYKTLQKMKNKNK